MFEVLHTVNELSLCYVDHPKFLKFLKDKYEKDKNGKANGFELPITPYMKANKRGVMQEIAWNVRLPYKDVKALEKIAKQDEYKSERDIENERKAAQAKEAAKLARQREREAVKAAKKAEEKARKNAEKAAKKAGQEASTPKRRKKNDNQMSLDI